MEKVAQPTPDDLPAFLPYVCAHLCLEFDLKITVVMEDEYKDKVVSGDIKKKKSATNLRNNSTVRQSEPAISAGGSGTVVSEEESRSGGGKVLRVTCVLAGPARATVALDLDHNSAVPRELMSVLRLCAPYNPQLTRLSARWSELEPAALHELVAMLPLGNISEVCLDNMRARAEDCCALLDVGRLRRLSLARCQLGDEGCTAVAEALAWPRPASLSLSALSLAGNEIGDAGALALACALRSNRTLRLLDLADNWLRDEGALAILRSLAEFPLTLKEILVGRRICMERALRQCLQVVRTALQEAVQARERRLHARTPQPSVSRVRTKHKEEPREMARKLEPSFEPFTPEEMVQRGEHLHSRGNTVLNSLNLAYNSLSLVSVRALLAALRGQAAEGAAGEGGLVRVQLVGNPLPVYAPEYDAATVLMEQALSAMLIAAKKQQKKVLFK